MSEPVEHMILEAVINPTLIVGDITIDGMPFPRVAFVHPRFGRIDLLLPLDSAQQLAALLQGVIERIEQHRMQRKC